VNRTKPLSLGLIEMSTQNCVHEIGLWNFEIHGSPPNQFLVIVRNDELFVFFGKAQEQTLQFNVHPWQVLLFTLLRCSQRGCQLPSSFEPLRERGIL